VFDDLHLIEKAKARGELRGMHYVRVVGPPEARRVVSADVDRPASTPLRRTTRSTADRGRRLAQIAREMNLARGEHLAQIEREVAQAKAAVPSIPHAAVEMYRARPYSGPLIRSFR
jgi:hypothetical protein